MDDSDAPALLLSPERKTVKCKLGILISGRGSNMQALVEGSRSPESPYEVVLVASDKPDAPGLVWAEEQGIATLRIPWDRKVTTQYHEALDSALRTANVEAIALAGYMRLLSPAFVARWRGRIVNIHPSLLPRYKGLDTHQRAIDAGDSHGGCSVHLVTEELDGGTVLGQARVPILPGDTADTLAKRVLAEEHRLYPHILAKWIVQRAD